MLVGHEDSEARRCRVGACGWRCRSAMLVMGALVLLGGRMGFGMWSDEGLVDPHSYSRPGGARVSDLDLVLHVDFETKRLKGEATWRVERVAEPGGEGYLLVLDTRDLTVSSVEVATGREEFRAARFSLGKADPILGAPLTVEMPADADRLRVKYETSPDASALQWVEPAGTFGKKHPFLYSQSQAIHARSWIPCQDTPSVRVRYAAEVWAPEGLTALMSADGVAEAKGGDGLVAKVRMKRWAFRSEASIPSYLIALAVGNLAKRDVSPRAAVWGEPEIVEGAAWEFADTERMIEAAERRFGPYRWGRYDILVLPPSFPYGGMENPKLTFATPTVLAGDRSQVALIAHELAHSWSGNLVTNATWSDFWLNEGFTTYLQNRIVEDVYGVQRAEMENVLGHAELLEELKEQAPRDQVLKVNLDGRDPDDGVTRIPYEKGSALLKRIEAAVGRERLDAFLKRYFDDFAFQSLTTSDFERYLNDRLFSDGAAPLNLREWIYEPGLPTDAVVPTSARFMEVEKLAAEFANGSRGVDAIDAKGWTTLEWVHFLKGLPKNLGVTRLRELDQAFQLTETGNAEVACVWFEMGVRAGYEDIDEKLSEYLRRVGRRRLIVPLYAALVATPEGKRKARAIFKEARAGYHPIAAGTIERIVGE